MGRLTLFYTLQHAPVSVTVFPHIWLVQDLRQIDGSTAAVSRLIIHLAVVSWVRWKDSAAGVTYHSPTCFLIWRRCFCPGWLQPISSVTHSTAKLLLECQHPIYLSPERSTVKCSAEEMRPQQWVKILQLLLVSRSLRGVTVPAYSMFSKFFWQWDLSSWRHHD